MPDRPLTLHDRLAQLPPLPPVVTRAVKVTPAQADDLERLAPIHTRCLNRALGYRAAPLALFDTHPGYALMAVTRPQDVLDEEQTHELLRRFTDPFGEEDSWTWVHPTRRATRLCQTAEDAARLKHRRASEVMAFRGVPGSTSVPYADAAARLDGADLPWLRTIWAEIDRYAYVITPTLTLRLSRSNMMLELSPDEYVRPFDTLRLLSGAGEIRTPHVSTVDRRPLSGSVPVIQDYRPARFHLHERGHVLVTWDAPEGLYFTPDRPPVRVDLTQVPHA